MSTQSTTFEDTISAIVQDFEAVGWPKTTDNTRPAYFELLGQRHHLSPKAVRGIWDSWLHRKSRGKGMFDRLAPHPTPAG